VSIYRLMMLCFRATRFIPQLIHHLSISLGNNRQRRSANLSNAPTLDRSLSMSSSKALSPLLPVASLIFWDIEGNIGRLLFTDGNIGNSFLLANILQEVSRHALLKVFSGLLNFEQLHDTVITSASRIITERSKPTRSSLPHVRLRPE